MDRENNHHSIPYANALRIELRSSCVYEIKSNKQANSFFKLPFSFYLTTLYCSYYYQAHPIITGFHKYKLCDVI